MTVDPCSCGSCDGDHNAWQDRLFRESSARGTAERVRARGVACPTCHVAVGDACRTSSGRRAEEPHAPRIRLSAAT